MSAKNEFCNHLLQIVVDQVENLLLSDPLDFRRSFLLNPGVHFSLPSK